MKAELKPTPKGINRWLYRLPIYFYRIGLGGFFGKRFILLFHKGRKTGLERQVLLEVIRYQEDTGTAFVIAAWGEKADWVRNITRGPAVRAQLGRKTYSASADILDPEDRVAEFLRYAHKYPRMAVALPGLVGYELDGSDEDFSAFAQQARIVAIRPVSETT